MTDSNATERLRELLDERGVKWSAHERYADLTYWGEGVGGLNKFASCTSEDDGRALDIELFAVTPEQAVAATLGSGTLTAEQVREAIERYSLSYGEIGRCFHDASWQAIADELNAALRGKAVRNAEH